MAKTRGELQKEYLDMKKKEVALQEKILRYEKEGIEVTGDMRRELSDLKKESGDTKKVLVDMWTKGTKANQEAKEAADDYIVSVGKNLADAAKKGGKAQTKAFEKTSGQWTELIAARQKASDAGQDTSQFDALINAGQEFLSQTEMSADQVEEFQKKLGDIDIDGLGDGAADLVGSLTKGSKALGLKSTIMDGLNLKALTLSAVMTAVADQIGDALESAQKFTDELGVSASRARQMEFSFKNLGLSLLGFRNDFQLAEVAAAKTFGSLQAAENSKLTDRMALISKTMGITADQAAELTFTMTNLTGLSQEQAAATVEAAGKMAELNDVAPSAVLADMADSAGVLAKFSDGTAEGMARAAIQARKLGINLAKAGQIADGLLDLETSMTNEMEASVLLGRDINLDRARQLALNNDIEGAMNAVLDQLGSEEEFNKLNAIQRQALADSIGVGVEDLAAMVSGDGAVEEAMPKAVSKTEFQILNARLSEKADLLELAEEQIWRLWALWQNKIWDGVVDYPDSFSIHDRSNTIALLKEAKETNPANTKLLEEIDNMLASALVNDEDKLAEIKEAQQTPADMTKAHTPMTAPAQMIEHMRAMVEQGYTDEQIMELHPEISEFFGNQNGGNDNG